MSSLPVTDGAGSNAVGGPAGPDYRVTGVMSVDARLLSQATPFRSGSILFGSLVPGRNTACACARLAERLDGIVSWRDPVTMFLDALTSAEAVSALPSSDDPVTVIVEPDGDRHGW